ncbi:hypothetical protein DI272_23385 [Streptomyces sp. Act143]|uniref:hypothetical protein n=1 Tax=Streptomyces sp. Act143 TaxID=2200760 RepID=UPI000D6767A8|nr:hypothetical protein [Streptomyces sp. Act143]PWI16776.1 hypothetical protein DI272_23385 [Streptomyces sp. Act143]
MHEPRTRPFLLVVTTAAFLLTLIGTALKITLETYFVPTGDITEGPGAAVDRAATFFAVTTAAAYGLVVCALVTARGVPRSADTPSDLPS